MRDEALKTVNNNETIVEQIWARDFQTVDENLPLVSVPTGGGGGGAGSDCDAAVGS